MTRAGLHILGVSAAILAAACSPAKNSAVDVSDVETPATVAKSRTVDDIDFTQYSTDLASFTDLRLGQSRIRAIDVVRLLHAPDAGEAIIKTSSSTFEIDGGGLMLLSASELADDSVRAQEFYLIFEGEPDAQKLAAYGLRVKCYRGENGNDWQKEPCP